MDSVHQMARNPRDAASMLAMASLMADAAYNSPPPSDGEPVHRCGLPGKVYAKRKRRAKMARISRRGNRR